MESALLFGRCVPDTTDLATQGGHLRAASLRCSPCLWRGSRLSWNLRPQLLLLSGRERSRFIVVVFRPAQPFISGNARPPRLLVVVIEMARLDRPVRPRPKLRRHERS